jgi:hypothetical protein
VPVWTPPIFHPVVEEEVVDRLADLVVLEVVQAMEDRSVAEAGVVHLEEEEEVLVVVVVVEAHLEQEVEEDHSEEEEAQVLLEVAEAVLKYPFYDMLIIMTEVVIITTLMKLETAYRLKRKVI